MLKITIAELFLMSLGCSIMNDSKITISLEEVNSSQVDAEIHRQDVAGRMAQHQEAVKQNYGHLEGGVNGSGIFQKAIVYMAFFGFISSLLGWAVGEGIRHIEEKHPWEVASTAFYFFNKEKPNATASEFNAFLSNTRNKYPELSNNQFLQNEFWNRSDKDIEQAISNAKSEIRLLDIMWSLLIASITGIGLSIAEAIVGKKWELAVKNGLLGGMLGIVGGLLVDYIANWLYHAMGGGQGNEIGFQQIFARSLGWGILGGFVAISPGIIMHSWKKFGLGIAGGIIGGMIGGMLFDPICYILNSVVFARFVNIVALGIGTAIATVWLENVAKQGWLKVASGLIAGKQFILYRNPTVIGSSPKSEIYLFKDPQVAPKHAAINKRDNNFLITSIENSIVFVNEQQVVQEKLKTGDRIRIGNTTFIFEAKVLKNTR